MTTEPTLRQPTLDEILIVSDVTGQEALIWSMDVALSEQQSRAYVVSDHPVEGGSVVSDHVQAQPVDLAVSGVVTNTPEDPAQQTEDRDLDAWTQLLLIADRRETVTVYLTGAVYRDMVITSISDSAAPGRGQVIEPSITFRQVVTAEQETVRVPAARLKPRVRSSANGRTDVGREQGSEKTGEGPGGDPASQKSSVLYDQLIGG